MSGSSAAAWIAVALAFVVVALRVVLSRPLNFCGTPDACYYLGMAQTLATGHGFHARFLYDFQQAHLTLPNTGIEYWRPGISLLLLVLKPLGGVTLHASIVLTTLVGVLFAAAAWHIAMQATGDRRLALTAFALCLLSAPAWIGSATPDSGLYYGTAVAWFLALFTIRRQGLLADLVALVCVGAAYLIRNDAAMLLIPLLAVLWVRHRQGRPAPTASGREGASPLYAVLMLALFFLALVPMHLLYRSVLGTAFPSGTSQVFFLNELADFGRYNDPVSLHSLLAHGVKHLVVFRVTTLATVLYRVAALMVGYPAMVFLPGLLQRPNSSPPEVSSADRRPLPEMTGPGSFALVTLLVYTLLLPAIGGFSALRTAVGLIPFISVLVILAIHRVARTQRLAAWLGAGVIAANAIAGLMDARRDIAPANMIGMSDRAEAQTMATMDGSPASSIVLTNDPVQFSVTTGYATVALPSNGLDAIAAAAHDFHATHVILDSENLPAPLASLKQALHPVRSTTLDREHSLILELPNGSAAR